MIAELVRNGQAVLVGANTVGGAQTTYRGLQQVLGPDLVRLLHSRFTGRDRLMKEQELTDLVGLDAGARPALVVVATQTIEVSLNVDFDTIYTEPAPLEALAQRFGRVNRKGRLARAPVHVLTQPDDGQRVYDARLVQRTLATLSRRDGHMLDEAELGRMLDEVYGDDLAEEFVREVMRSEREFARSCLDDLRAFQSDEALTEQFDQLFDGVEVVPAALVQAFKEELARSVIDAQGFLVPISYRQLARFARAGRVQKLEDDFLAIDAPYDEETGLQLTATAVGQGEG